MTRLWQANKQALMSFLRDDCISLAAALAFFSMLSLAPLLVLLVTAGAYIGRDNQARIVDRVQSALGPPAGDALQQMLANAEAHKVAATYSAVIGITSVVHSPASILQPLDVGCRIRRARPDGDGQRAAGRHDDSAGNIDLERFRGQEQRHHRQRISLDGSRRRLGRHGT